MNKNSEKIKEYLDESKLLGIEFEPININESCYDFVISNNKIVLPLSLIKSIAFNVCEEITIERTAVVSERNGQTYYNVNYRPEVEEQEVEL